MKNHPSKKINFLHSTYGISRRELAERLGISLESMNEVMDENQIVLPHVLKKICRTFKLAEDFFHEELRVIDGLPKIQDGTRADHGNQHLEAAEMTKQEVLTQRYQAYPHKVVAKRTRKG